MPGYLQLVEVQLHFPEAGDLKQKRKHLASLKSQLRSRFGASVAETDHHDLWQRSTLLCAVVGDAGSAAVVDDLVRFVESRHPDGCGFERHVVSLEDVRA